MNTPSFTGAQEHAIEYIVLASSNQGKAYAAGRDAELAVKITLEEDRRLKSHQLSHPHDSSRRMHISSAMRREAERRTAAQWEDDQ